MPNHVYRVGDSVRIIGNSNSHGFDIGEIVTLVNSHGCGDFAGNVSMPPNYLRTFDLEFIGPQSITISCCHCAENVNAEEARNYNSNRYCASCYEERYSNCEDCDSTNAVEDLIYTDGGDYICRRCYDKEDRIIKDYSYRPKAYVYEKMAWENTLYLGIELEVEVEEDEDREPIAEKAIAWLKRNKVDSRVYIKDDGSLDNGFELVFMPSTLQAIHKKFPMYEFLRYLKRIGCEACHTCGLHVHLSKKDMTSRDLWAGKLFFWKCTTQLKKFSGRESFDYCKFDASMPSNHTTQNHGRYSALNTATCTETVELRLFESTLEYEQFLAALQMSDCFGNWIKKVNVILLKTKSASHVWGKFLSYAKAEGRYGQFLKYVKAKEIK